MNKNKVKKIVTTTTTVTEEIIKLNGKTHIICILDRSGSMDKIIDDSIGGFNSFLKQQKEIGDNADLTLVLFDDKYDLIHNQVNIMNVEDITSKIWYPRGYTALFDAIGKTINTVKSKDEYYEKTLVCIITDGMENGSHEYNSDSIKKLISEAEKDGWEFIYLGANQDAFATGGSFGIRGANTYTYSFDSAGTKNAFANASYYTATLRCKGVGNFINNTDDAKSEGTKTDDPLTQK